MLERDQMTLHDRRFYDTTNALVVGADAGEGGGGELGMIELGGVSRGSGSGSGSGSSKSDDYGKGKGTVCASPIMIKELI